MSERSEALLIPEKLILVPLIKAFGFNKNSFKLVAFQFSSARAIAGEYLNLLTDPTFFPKIPQRFGPILLEAPSLAE